MRKLYVSRFECSFEISLCDAYYKSYYFSVFVHLYFVVTQLGRHAEILHLLTDFYFDHTVTVSAFQSFEMLHAFILCC